MKSSRLAVLLLAPLWAFGDAGIVPHEIGVKPFMEGFKWGQMTDTGYLDPSDKPCFNYYTPAQTNCGCVATALAQIMRHYRWPSADARVSAGEYLCAFGDTGVYYRVESRAFDWDKMPLNPAVPGTSENDRREIGHFVYDIAVSVGAQFAAPQGGTYASMVSAYMRLKDRYYFRSCEGVEFFGEHYPYDEDVLKKMVIPCCDYGSPVLLSVKSGEFRHEILVDGYGYDEKTNFVVHALMGSYGNGDGWFRPPHFFVGKQTFDEVCGGLYNILPKQKGTIVSGRVWGVNGDPVGNVPVTLVDSTGASWTTLSRDSDDGRGAYAFLVPNPGKCTVVASADGVVGSNEVEVVANASPQVDTATGDFYPDQKPTVGNVYGQDIRLEALPGVEIQTVEMPVIVGTDSNPYSISNLVAITCGTEGATVRYTTDGSDPTWASPEYEGPFVVCDSQTVTVKAKAWKEGWYASRIASGNFTAGDSHPVGDDYACPILIAGTNGVRTVARLANYGLEGWETIGYPHMIQACEGGGARGFPYYHTVWFKWTAPGSGRMKFFASNSSTNVAGAFVAVYTGDVERLACSPGESKDDKGKPVSPDVSTNVQVFVTGYSEHVDPLDCDYSEYTGEGTPLTGADRVEGSWCWLNYVDVDVEKGKTYRLVLMVPFDYKASTDPIVHDRDTSFYYLKWKGDLTDVELPDHGPEPVPTPVTRHFLTLDAVGGRNLGEVVRLVEEGDASDLPQSPSRDGYDFGGWYTNAADGVAYDVQSKLFVTAPTVVRARWKAMDYEIRYENVDREGPRSYAGPASYTIEDLVVLTDPEPPATRSNVHFDRWEPSGVIPVGSTGTVSFAAQWAIDMVTVTYDANGGTVGEASRTVTKGEPVGALPTPEFAGYDFAGWFNAVEGGDRVTAESVLPTSMTVYARWSPIVYKIAYELGGGVNAATNPTSYTVKCGEIVLADPIRDHYAFTGWIPDGGVIAGGSTNDRVFTATWQRVYPTLFDAAAVSDLSPNGATYNGFIGDESLGGTFTLVVKRPKAGATTAAAVLTKVDALTGNKVKLSGTVDVNTGNCSDGLAGLVLNATGVGGELDGQSVQGARDAAKAKDDDALGVMAGFDKKVAAVVFDGADGSRRMLTATFSKKGKVKVAGTVDGVKISGSAQMSVGDRCAVPFVWSKKGIRISFVLWFNRDATAHDVTGTGGDVRLVAFGDAKVPESGEYKLAMAEEDVRASVSGATNVMCEVVTTFDGKKFDAGNAAKVKYDKKTDTLTVDPPTGKDVSGLKLKYAKGSISGSFTIYEIDAVKGKLVKNKFTVSGVVVDGVGYGLATNKKLKAIPVKVSKFLGY